MKRQIGQFQVTDTVSQNDFWQIHKAQHIETSQSYTIKQIGLASYKDNYLLQECIANEIACNKNIVGDGKSRKYLQNFEGTLKSQNNIYLIYEKYYEVQIGPISLDKSIQFINQILIGINMIHQAGFIHGDVRQGNVKLANYETAILQGGYFYRQDQSGLFLEVTKQGGSDVDSYLAPEVIKKGFISKTMDMYYYQDNIINIISYQLGILFYFLIYGELPFRGESLEEKSSRVCITFGSHQKVPNVVKEVIRGMLETEMESRLTFTQIQSRLFKQEWIEDLNFDQRWQKTRKDIEDIKNELGLQHESRPLQSRLLTNDDQLIRNKYILMMNVVGAIFDLSSSENCLQSGQILSGWAQKQCKKLSQQFEGGVYELLNGEQRMIENVQKCFGMQIKDEMRILHGYVVELREQLNGDSEQLRGRKIIHLNNVLDVLDIDRFFDSYMVDREADLRRQPYFEAVMQLSERELLQVIDSKMHQLKIKE